MKVRIKTIQEMERDNNSKMVNDKLYIGDSLAYYTNLMEQLLPDDRIITLEEDGETWATEEDDFIIFCAFSIIPFKYLSCETNLLTFASDLFKICLILSLDISNLFQICCIGTGFHVISPFFSTSTNCSEGLHKLKMSFKCVFERLIFELSTCIFFANTIIYNLYYIKL